jgi:hypothetical protein
MLFRYVDFEVVKLIIKLIYLNFEVPFILYIYASLPAQIIIKKKIKFLFLKPIKHS